MKKLILLITVIILSFSAFGQHDLGLKLNGGVSCLNMNPHSRLQDQKDRLQFSGQGGVYYNYTLPKHFMVGAELLFVQIEGKTYNKILFTDELGNYIGDFGTYKILQNISYFGLPVYFGYKIKKFTINLGFQVNYMLTGSAIEKGEVTFKGETSTFKNIHKKLAIDNFDYGPRIGFTYGLSERFSLEANYYYGLNNLLTNSIGRMKWNIQQCTLGLQLKLFKVAKSSKI
jgi:hypothetical protein